ncbi:MAG: hypothetical protein N2246_03180, partial [Candidatus Sumerlaeia bacterium]|nr:hypothetical protein [Candidatus Sumerlaeia bacterium]
MVVSAHSISIEGIYLTGDGSEYLEIKRRPIKERATILINKIGVYLFEDKETREERLFNSPGGAYSISGYGYPEKNNLRVTLKDNNLIISSPEVPTKENVWQTYIEMAPSPAIRGDWDLLKISYTFPEDPLSQFSEVYNYKPQPICKVFTLPRPIPSFLHRVDDNRVVEYFTEINNSMPIRSNDFLTYSAPRGTPRLFELASALAAKYPTDIFIHTIYLDSLIIQRDYKALAVDLDKWKISYQLNDNPFVQNVLKCCELALYAHSLSESGQNGFDFMEKLLSSQTDLDTRLKILPDILDYKEYVCPIQTLTRFINYAPDITSLQVAAKVFRTEATFLMLQGKNEEALQILAGIYRMGQFLKQDYILISNLIGIAVQMIACGGLELYILNACNTPEEFQRLWKIFAELDKVPHNVDLERTLKIINPLYSMFNIWKNLSPVN